MKCFLLYPHPPQDTPRVDARLAGHRHYESTLLATCKAHCGGEVIGKVLTKLSLKERTSQRQCCIFRTSFSKHERNEELVEGQLIPPREFLTFNEVDIICNLFEKEFLQMKEWMRNDCQRPMQPDLI